MQKILIVHSSKKISGGEVISINIKKRLENIFNFSFYIPYSKDSSEINIGTDQIFFSKKNNIFSIIRGLKKTLKKVNPEIVHAHGIRAAFIIKIFLLLNKKRFIFLYTIHGFHIIHKTGLKNEMVKKFEKISNHLLVNKIICVGKDEYNLIKKNSISSNKVITINNGINKPKRKSDSAIEKFCKKYDYNLVTICRLQNQKDVKTLILAVKGLPKNISLTVIGSGPLEPKLKKISKGCNNILFIHKNKASDLLHYFDIFILSTNWEGLPLVILESMLARVPVIGSSVTGVKELINKNNGLLFEPKNAHDLKNKILYLMSNNKEKLEMIEKAYNNVIKNYSIDKMINKYKNLYQSYENPSNK